MLAAGCGGGSHHSSHATTTQAKSVARTRSRPLGQGRSRAGPARPCSAPRSLATARLPDDRRPRQQPDHHRQSRQADRLAIPGSGRPEARTAVAGFNSPGRIDIIKPSGHIVWTYGPTSGPGELDQPSLAVELPNGTIAATDDWNHCVVVIDRARKRIVWQYGHDHVAGDAPGFCASPTASISYPDAIRVGMQPRSTQSFAALIQSNREMRCLQPVSQQVKPPRVRRKVCVRARARDRQRLAARWSNRSPASRSGWTKPTTLSERSAATSAPVHGAATRK